MAIESTATNQSSLTGGISGSGNPIGISPTNFTLCTEPRSNILDINVPPTTAINSAGMGNMHNFEHRG